MNQILLPWAVETGRVGKIYRVLIAEDEPASAQLMKEILRRYNLRVDTVEDGRMALKRMEVIRYDLLISDYAMPYMDGMILMHNLRNLNIKTPVLFVTANSSKNLVIRAMNTGIKGYIVKPITPNKLLNEIFKVLDLTKEDLVERKNIPLDIKIDRVSAFQILLRTKGVPAPDAAIGIFADIESLFMDNRKPEKIIFDFNEEFLLEETSLHIIDQLLEKCITNFKLKTGDFRLTGSFFSHIPSYELQQTKNLSRISIMGRQ